MTSDFVTKRPHKKSRAGCQTCKTKKVKCDEVQPKCGFCEKRSLTCVYTKTTRQSPSTGQIPSPQPAEDGSNPSSPHSGDEFDDVPGFWDLVTIPRSTLNTALGNLSPLDLRMMHHWSTATWNTLAVGSENSSIMLMHVPQLAFENDFLLNCILGISSLHTEYLKPSAPDNALQKRQTAIYRVKALNGFRESLTSLTRDSAGANPLSWEAALIMAILLIILCHKDHETGDAEDELSILKWLVLYRGLASIFGVKGYKEVFKTGVYPIFRREIKILYTTPVIPRHLLKLVEEISPMEPDFECLESYCKFLDALSTLYACLQQFGNGDELWVRTISLPSYGTQQFCNVSREKRPRPLIILAHFLVFLKLVNGLWWLDGMSDKEIKGIAEIVGEEWAPYMQIPLAATRMSSKQEIIRMLLS
ncbi:hypothetical protein BGZ60DRAFT_531964 [Tricladium varicosporioides]|nr:hypothetical protein BGZ60DRAFT_531964 [Hymenoscyphus varicosporioides]